MSTDTYRGQPEKDLRGKLAELHAENFKSGFTSEKMSSQKGSQMRARKKEIARILTVLSGRAAMARHEAAGKKLELRLGGMGKPHEGSREDKRRRSLLASRLATAKRALRELVSVTPEAAKAVKPAKAAKVAKKK